LTQKEGLKLHYERSRINESRSV